MIRDRRREPSARPPIERERRVAGGRRRGVRERRRRIEDGVASSRRSRGRGVVDRYKLPLLGGLTLAGAAAPLSRAVEMQPGERPAADRQGEAHLSRASVGDRVAGQWAEARAERLRNDTIEGARVRYGIDRELAEAIHDIAIQEGIEPDVAFGLVNVESEFRQRAVSHVGARGLAQVMPRTARAIMPGVTAEDLFDRRTNLTVGFRYLRQMVDKYGGNTRLALLAYNRGPGTVDRVLLQGGDPDNGYADRVLAG